MKHFSDIFPFITCLCDVYDIIPSSGGRRKHINIIVFYHKHNSIEVEGREDAVSMTTAK